MLVNLWVWSSEVWTEAKIGHGQHRGVADAKAMGKVPGRSVWNKKRKPWGLWHLEVSRRWGTHPQSQGGVAGEAPKKRARRDMLPEGRWDHSGVGFSSGNWDSRWQQPQWNVRNRNLVIWGWRANSQFRALWQGVWRSGQRNNGTHNKSRASEDWHLFTQFCPRPWDLI